MATKKATGEQTPGRPDVLRFVGERDPFDRPAVWLDGIPARDLAGRDIARLSDDQITRALDSGLYAAGSPPDATEPEER